MMRKVLVVGLAILLVAATLAIWHALFLDQEDSGNHFVPLVKGVKCLNGEKNLGVVWGVDDLKISFEFENSSDDEAAYVELRGDCACFSIDPSRFVLAPQQKRPVAIHLNVQNSAKEGQAEQSTIDHKILARVVDEQGDVDIVGMRIYGSTKALFTSPRKEIDFGRVVRGDTPTEALDIHCHLPGPVKVETMMVPSYLKARIEPSYSNADRFKLHVAIESDAPTGSFRERLRIQAIGADSRRLTWSLMVRGDVVADLCSLPSAIVIWPALVGKECSAIVTSQSRKQRTFRLTGAEIVDQYNVRGRVELQETASSFQNLHKWAITVVPQTKGKFTAAILIHYETQDGTSQETRVPITGFAEGSSARKGGEQHSH